MVHMSEKSMEQLFHYACDEELPEAVAEAFREAHLEILALRIKVQDLQDQNDAMRACSHDTFAR